MMRFLLPLAALVLVLPTASAGLVQELACAAEDATLGGDAVCDEANGRTVPLAKLICAFAWFVAEQPHPKCGEFLRVEHEGETYYVSVGPHGVYQETNGCEGLQQDPSDCDADGTVEPRDEPVRTGLE